MVSVGLSTESSTILYRFNKRAHHLGVYEVAVKLVELVQPKVEAIEVRIRRIIRIALQVAEVLHLHKRQVCLTVREVCVLSHSTNRTLSSYHVGDVCRALELCYCGRDVRWRQRRACVDV